MGLALISLKNNIYNSIFMKAEKYGHKIKKYIKKLQEIKGGNKTTRDDTDDSSYDKNKKQRLDEERPDEERLDIDSDGRVGTVFSKSNISDIEHKIFDYLDLHDEQTLDLVSFSQSNYYKQCTDYCSHIWEQIDEVTDIPDTFKGKRSVEALLRYENKIENYTSNNSVYDNVICKQHCKRLGRLIFYIRFLDKLNQNSTDANITNLYHTINLLEENLLKADFNKIDGIHLKNMFDLCSKFSKSSLKAKLLIYTISSDEQMLFDHCLSHITSYDIKTYIIPSILDYIISVNHAATQAKMKVMQAEKRSEEVKLLKKQARQADENVIKAMKEATQAKDLAELLKKHAAKDHARKAKKKAIQAKMKVTNAIQNWRNVKKAREEHSMRKHKKAMEASNRAKEYYLFKLFDKVQRTSAELFREMVFLKEDTTLFDMLIIHKHFDTAELVLHFISSDAQDVHNELFSNSALIARLVVRSMQSDQEKLFNHFFKSLNNNDIETHFVKNTLIFDVMRSKIYYMKKLINKIYDISAELFREMMLLQNYHGYTILHLSVKYHKFEVADFLLNLISQQSNAQDLYDELLSKRCDLDGQSVLMTSIQNNMTDIAIKLVEQSNDNNLSVKDNWKRSALHYAVEHDFAVANAIIQKITNVKVLSATLSIQDDDDETPLDYITKHYSYKPYSNLLANAINEKFSEKSSEIT